MEWNWDFAIEVLPLLLEGAVVTIVATLLGAVLALALGLMFALGQRSPSQWVAVASRSFARFIRGTPLLIQLYFLFYVLPDVGIKLSPLTAGVIGFGLHYATYVSEVYRAGIDNVPRGQWEAAKATNLTVAQTWRYVVLPQAVPPMIPALANYCVGMFKETPLLSVVTVLELMGQATIVSNYTYRYLEPITLVGAIFLTISLVSVWGLRALEKRFGRIGT
jgi:polar amino acid transport system permease protein